MNHRERLLAAIDRRQPDRIPVDFGSTATTTITRLPYLALRKALGLPDVKPRILSFTAQSVCVDEDLLALLDIDTRGVKPSAGTEAALTIRREGEYETFFNEWGCGFRRPVGTGLYYDIFHHPLRGGSRREIEAYPFPKGDDPARVGGLREQCEAIRRKGMPVVFGQSIGSGVLHTGTALLGFEDYFTRLLLEPADIEALTERILDVKLRFWETVFAEVGDLVDVVAEADDLGTQRGPMISPEVYRAVIRPYHARLFSFIRKKSPQVKIFFHSCGSVAAFIPDLIEIGVDALNPVQVSAEGMEPLRSEAGIRAGPVLLGRGNRYAGCPAARNAGRHPG